MNRISRLVVLFFVLFLSVAVYAQDTAWINFTDGHKVIDMARDSNTLWIATSGGIVKYDIQSNSKIFYTKSNSELASYSITSIATDKSHNLWIGTDGNGIYEFDGTGWINNPHNVKLPTQYITDICVDNSDNIWIGCRYWLESTFPHPTMHFGGLLRFNGNTWTDYSAKLSSQNSVKMVYSVKTNKTGKIYIADGSLIIFDGINWNYYYPNDLSSNGVKQFSIDTASHIWTLQDTDTLTEFDEISWHNYTVPTGITSDMMYLYSICSDSLNNIWLGFESDNNLGLLKYDGINWISYNTSNSGIETNRISSLFLSKKLLYIGTNGKEINTLDSTNNWSVINTSNSPLYTNWLETVFSDNSGNILTSAGNIDNVTQLAKFDGVNWSVFDSLPTGTAEAIAIDHYNDIWIGSWNGIAKYDGNSWVIYDTSNTDFPNSDINSIAIDRNNLVWIAGGSAYEAFVAKFDGISWSVFRPLPDLVPYEFSGIIIDNSDNKWLSGYEGLYKFDGTNWTLFDAINGPMDFDRMVFDLKYNSDNNTLWLATSKGLVKYDFVNFFAFTNTWIETCGIDYNNNNVWISPYFSDSLLCYQSDGELLKSSTSQNSGLPLSPYVRSITIANNGDVYLATGNNGLVLDKKGSMANNINIVNTSGDLLVMPNPCSHFLKIAINNDYGLFDLKIYNLSGQLVKSLNLQNGTAVIDISDLEDGMYILDLSNRNIRQRTKIIKN